MFFFPVYGAGDGDKPTGKMDGHEKENTVCVDNAIIFFIFLLFFIINLVGLSRSARTGKQLLN